ncbi:hypothetical protein M3M39_00680 [Fructilactobacillus hinvesii]|uniref:Uncharacterized protein n=1 Tax=Fructilactobacillus hinvesii TaxID=2940300 RepID=A0ABY5BUU1_9LACO|nr:hypothetical protein [Fructilactobacillus hinvesii]USS88036.1 hypothetical protein M3M39_00680 [Fructilactobacillus hinvesii]
MLVFLLKRGTKLLSAIVNIAVVLAIISLFFWILAEIQYPFNSQIFINWGGKHYVPGFWGLHFLAQEPASFFGLQLVRNTGLYAEAPMFSFVLSVAFIFNLFYLKHSPTYYFRGIVLFATIITTVSTTGLLICFLALVGNLVMKHWDLYTRLPRRKKYYIWIGLGGLLLVGLSLIWINKVNTFQGSVSIRSDDIKAGWNSFLQSPIFGNGLGNLRAIKRLMASYRLMKGGNHGFSLGILQILSYGGVIFLAFYLIPLIMAFMRKHYVDAFVLLLVMVLLTLTIVNETPLLIFILIFMVCKELPNWRNEND